MTNMYESLSSMSIIKWEPFKDLKYIQDKINSIIDSSSNNLRTQWTPAVNVIEFDNMIIIEVELPRVSEDDIEVQINENILAITGNKKSPELEYGNECIYKIESSYGRFCRTFALPDNINTDTIKASLNDGLLRITLYNK